MPGLEEALKKAGSCAKELGVRIEIVGVDPPALSAAGGLK
jgi:hypothetical protein